MSAPPFEDLARQLSGRAAAPFGLRLRLEELTLSVRSNSAAIIDDLRRYFAPFIVEDSGGANLDFLFLDGPAETPPVELAVRPHLPGKKPDKERCADLAGLGLAAGGGRVVRKQATGMLFVFGHADGQSASGSVNIAVGPCAQNRNQLVNFLCARYMERRVAQGWILGHASGVVKGALGLALCGFAGMGKSTLALHLVAQGCDFLSNDRVLVEPKTQARPVLHGIPKHPRLNPGTALGNPDLAPLLACALPPGLRRAYAALPPAALYAVEDKFDAVIGECFGAADELADAATSMKNAKGSRFRLAAPLSGLAVLNWRHGGGPMQARRVDLASRPDLLEAFRKPPGAFYLPQALETARLTASECLEALSGVPALELFGGSDFEAGTTACLKLLEE